MKSICIIGAGNIGSRHLQALKKVNFPLSVDVVDSSDASLKIAEERYSQVNLPNIHKISFWQNMENLPKEIDLAIVATNSNVRRNVIEQLFKNSNVQYLILEKILFPKIDDYSYIKKFLERNGCTTWVNFSMRTMPFYYNLREKIKNNNVQLNVSGSQFGLVTNAIHYVDYMAFLTSCNEFKVDPANLEYKPIESKRPGFLELNGTLNVYFKDGSFGSFTCYPAGISPIVIEIFSQNYRCISKETEKKAWISTDKSSWNWIEVESKILFQSDMTNKVVEEILKDGTCNLTPYNQACKLHLVLLENLLEFINKYNSNKFNYFPFT